MADIFGRESHEYQLVSALQSDNLWDDYQRAAAEERPEGKPYHDFDALYRRPGGQKRAGGDDQVMGYITNNLLAVQTMVDEVLYTAYRLPNYLHLNTSIPEGASSYSLRVRDRSGRAERITAPGYDAPSATANEYLVTQVMHWYGIDAEWSLDELRGSMFGGFPLDTESIRAAVTGAMETMEAVGLTGGDYAEKGLLNLAYDATDATPVRTTTSTKWSAISTEQSITIRNRINGELSSLIDDSSETVGRDITAGMTVYLPGPQYDLLTTLYVGDNADKTLMTSILTDNPWTNFSKQPLMIERVQELRGIASISNAAADRMVITLRNPRIAEMGVSISPRVLGVQDQGRVVCTQVEAKFSPVFVKRPNLIRYHDGI